jgi:hypothetical protein
VVIWIPLQLAQSSADALFRQALPTGGRFGFVEGVTDLEHRVDDLECTGCDGLVGMVEDVERPAVD